VLRVGGPVQSIGHGFQGRKVFELWKQWAASSSNKLGFTVQLDLRPFVTRAMAKTLAAQATDPKKCGDSCVDVLVCPYGSEASYAAVQGVPEGSKVPILVWGGAAESIFSEACRKRKCFGTLTGASQYFLRGLQGVRAASSDIEELSVALIRNPSFKFSVDAINGAHHWLKQNKGFSPPLIKELHGQHIPSRTSLSPTDLEAVDEIISKRVDVIVMALGEGSSDVVQTILRIANTSNYRPKAILAKNAISGESESQFRSLGMLQYQDCLLMPSQWAAIRGLKDSIVGWDAQTLVKDLGFGYITYHAAAAAAAVISVTHAIQKWSPTDWSHLASQLAKVDIETLYGQVKFNEDGSLSSESKPMYLRQKQDETTPIVYPVWHRTAGLRFPLSQCPGWNPTNYTAVRVRCCAHESV
jgi:hypothetical protein